MNVDIKETTPIEKVGNIYLKRDDKFEIYGVKGGKARSAYQLIKQGLEDGYKEFVTAGSRMSPQYFLHIPFQKEYNKNYFLQNSHKTIYKLQNYIQF